jgi:hypothetical protein
VQELNYGHGALLRTHRDRPCSDRATEQADELASLHAPHEDSSCCPDNEQRIATHSLHRKMATSRAEPRPRLSHRKAETIPRAGVVFYHLGDARAQLNTPNPPKRYRRSY